MDALFRTLQFAVFDEYGAPADDRVQDFIRTYGQSCADAAIERCAKVCEEVEASAWALWKMGADPIEQGRNIGAQHCADAIRALKGQPT